MICVSSAMSAKMQTAGFAGPVKDAQIERHRSNISAPSSLGILVNMMMPWTAVGLGEGKGDGSVPHASETKLLAWNDDVIFPDLSLDHVASYAWPAAHNPARNGARSLWSRRLSVSGLPQTTETFFSQLQAQAGVHEKAATQRRPSLYQLRGWLSHLLLKSYLTPVRPRRL